MINKKLLLYKIAEKGHTVKEISVDIGVNPSTFYRKIEKNTFTCAEVTGIAKDLSLTAQEIMDIFFANRVA